MVIADELLADDEGLGQPIRARLDRIGQVDPELRTVLEEPDIPLLVLRCGDHQDIPDPGKHQDREGVVDHGFIIDRQKVLGYPTGDRVEPGPAPAGEHNAFHTPTPSHSRR